MTNLTMVHPGEGHGKTTPQKTRNNLTLPPLYLHIRYVDKEDAVTCWRDDNWQTAGNEEHLKVLEKELKKSADPILAGHIQQLKKAWGFACKMPRETGAAA